jgi:uncharacterized protein (TIGR00255 family)
MTGYASASGGDISTAWSWDVRSVNGRSLELRTRLPHGFDRLDPAVRQATQKRFQRGSMTLALSLESLGRRERPRVDRELLSEYARLAQAIAAETGIDAPRVDGLMALDGVIEREDSREDGNAEAVRDTAILTTLDAALAQLAEARHREGKAIATALLGHVDAITAATDAAASLAVVRPEALRAKLEAQIAELLGPANPVTPEKLAQEVAGLVLRADIREELDRLRAHAAEARRLIEGGGAIGRKFEFLSQELNREANTLCSKSTDLTLTRLGLELKTAIDRLREQAANIE